MPDEGLLAKVRVLRNYEYSMVSLQDDSDPGSTF